MSAAIYCEERLLPEDLQPETQLSPSNRSSVTPLLFRSCIVNAKAIRLWGDHHDMLRRPRLGTYHSSGFRENTGATVRGRNLPVGICSTRVMRFLKSEVLEDPR